MSTNNLCSDEDVRRFIVDGYHRIDTDVAPEVHDRITEKLKKYVVDGKNPGDNIVPMIPEFGQVLNSPAVDGALRGLLGNNYISSPHRHAHELDNNADGSGRTSYHYTFHQDSHAPPPRACHHYPRYALLLYYPQEMPVDFGPTHVIAGTQYNRGFSEEEKKTRGIPAGGKKGVCYLLHFDIVHGAGVNTRDERRYMMKFVFIRTEEPAKPNWDCRDADWRPPHGADNPHQLPFLWSHVWDWMSGREDRYTSLRASGALADAACPAMAESNLAALDSEDQAERNEAIYALGAIGAPAIAPLMERLEAAVLVDKTTGMMDRHTGWGNPPVMEPAAHALAAVGSAAIPALIDGLDHANEWTRINAAFALGEIGPAAAAAVPSLAAKLTDASPRVACTAIDSLGTIQQDAETAVPALIRTLQQAEATHEDARLNATVALARLGPKAAAAEDVLVDALDDPSYHIGYFAAHALRRIDTARAEDAAFAFFETRSLNQDSAHGTSG